VDPVDPDPVDPDPQHWIVPYNRVIWNTSPTSKQFKKYGGFFWDIFLSLKAIRKMLLGVAKPLNVVLPPLVGVF
jgi:hypothetical protein